jgi:hypothetical protein
MARLYRVGCVAHNCERPLSKFSELRQIDSNWQLALGIWPLHHTTGALPVLIANCQLLLKELSMKVRIALVVLLLPVFALLACAQDASKRPSPAAQAQCKFTDGKTVKTDYSSPRMKGRKIFGGLVPYGEVWRAGANDATTLVTDTNLNIGGKDVPAGNYTIFALPNADKWVLIISKKTGEWGIPYPGQGDDFARVDMSVSQLPAPVEDFTIGFDQTGSTCAMHLDWEKTRASVNITQKK